MITGIEHIAIASRNIDGARSLFRDLLGLEILGRETVEEQRITTDIYDAEYIHMEVMEPTADDSPIAKFLEKRGEGLHHICFSVENIEEMLQELEAAGIELIDSQPRTGAGGKKIAFLHPKSTHGVLIELSEYSGDNI